MKVLALDYGSARTGVAISDPSGTVARPLEVVARAGSDEGRRRLVEIVEEEGAELVVVGMPLTLRGEHGAQAEETEAFVVSLRSAVRVPVETFDERFTTSLARSGNTGAGQPRSPEDARAAAHLLTGYLTWTTRRA